MSNYMICDMLHMILYIHMYVYIYIMHACMYVDVYVRMCIYIYTLYICMDLYGSSMVLSFWFDASLIDYRAFLLHTEHTYAKEVACVYQSSTIWGVRSRHSTSWTSTFTGTPLSM